MKRNLFLIFFFCSSALFAQKDTLVLHDYTKVMVTTSNGVGKITPITDLEGLSQAGFFLHKFPVGKVRICNDGEVYVWANGRLIEKIDGCELFDPKNFYSSSRVDTVFVSFTPKNSFSEFKCQLITYENLQVVKSNVSKARNVRNPLSEFIILALVILIIILGFLVGYHSSRAKYILEKTFTFKTNAYEFINTAFASTPSIISMCLLSLLLGFLGTYTSELFWNSSVQNSLLELIWNWLQLSAAVFIALIIKRIFIGVLSNLFEFKGLRNFQMFDFINFNIFFFVPVAIIVFLEFIFSPAIGSWMPSVFTSIFPFVVVMFLIWFTLKFVSQDPRRKLIIFSYLCATEIIPAVFLVGWFLK